ncbi:methyl-accepting chemotaxis protein [Halalkalibacter wakoensis JCM 9140]|uniref:Methyl-accepting chemotaxis protein n=1 Tax=Halalkalibacter wakoensis JCM 9140 TaxID=1236970 RepID=W4Q2Z6_9BACI|nr:globin-coupled sensor protein [Halalkalibacter wakoensis]GAE26093.1 methyl-accepting chemotaxis protein [Halalkalibacter wakoensis JCM 9140]
MKQLFKAKKPTTKQSKLLSLMERELENVFIDIPSSSTLTTQIEMIDLTTEDLAIIRNFQPYIKSQITEIVSNFYKNLAKEPSLMQIINDHSTIERLKGTLHTHISELFNGQIDEKFIQQRNIIAHVHVRIGLQPKWYMCAFQDLLSSISSIVDEQTSTKEEYKKITNAVTKILNLEQQLVLEAYELENERIRNEVNKQKNLLRDEVSKSAGELAAVSEETSSSLQEMTAKTTEITKLTEQSSNIAISTESKSQEGKKRLNSLENIMVSTQTNMKKISSEMEQLIVTSKKIEQISQIVTSIADQTNLLALNASIEAARAGEQGKGFAVVAGEVRKLAENTKETVSEVSNLVNEINRYTMTMSNSIAENNQSIERGTTESTETNRFFDDILSSMEQMKQQNMKISDEMKTLADIFNEINQAAEHVAVSSDNLTNITHSL